MRLGLGIDIPRLALSGGSDYVSIVENGVLASFVTFTRASSGTYFDSAGVMQTALTNIPRIDYDPSTLALRGLLAKEARTNLCLHSRDLTNAAWVSTNVTAAKDQTGIDAVAGSASKITATAGNGTCLQSVVSASAARSTTAYVKRITGSGVIEMTQDGGTTWAPVTVTASWTRVGPATATVTNPQIGFRIATSGDAIAVDAMQLETGAFATSAILTTTASVTRAADSAVISTLSQIAFNATEGTIFISAIRRDAANRSAHAMALDDSTGNNFITALMSAPAVASGFRYRLGGGGETSVTPVNVGANNEARIAFAYKANDFAVSVNGSAVSTNGTLSVPTLNRLVVGARGSEYLNGTIKNLRYYPRRLSNAELQALTT